MARSVVSSVIYSVARSVVGAREFADSVVYDPLDWILVSGLWDDAKIWVNSEAWVD